MRERITPPWALLLAGGDGTRLRPLTTQIVGDARPNRRTAPVILYPLLHMIDLAGDVRPAWLDRVHLAEAG
jgi:hypothetical protein